LRRDEEPEQISAAHHPGYALNGVRLTEEQQLDVISHTFRGQI
jgi:autonomous glycyl radical cofactor GrcA